MPGTATQEQEILARSIAATIGLAALAVVAGLISNAQSIAFDGAFSGADVVTSTMTLVAVRLLAGAARCRFRHGLWHIEPMMLVLGGSVLVLLCMAAVAGAVGSLMNGGRLVVLDWAIAYATIEVVICLAMYRYEASRNRRVDSAFVRLDILAWLMSAAMTAGLLLAFLVARSLQDTSLQHLASYVDGVVLALLAMCLALVPLRTIAGAWSELFLVAPSELDARVRAVMDMTVARHGYLSHTSYVAKVGRARFVEVHVLVPPGFRPDGVASQDAVRAEIAAAIGLNGPQAWLTISFTADARWT